MPLDRNHVISEIMDSRSILLSQVNSFVAIDFETANPDSSSICQVGIVTFENGSCHEEWSVLVNPEDHFDHWNISIHGITENDVRGSLRFPEIYPQLRQRLENKIVVSHGWFDRRALENVLRKYQLSEFNHTWVDSTRIVRRCLPEFSRKGYGLQNIASHFNLSTRAHDALDDARTCARIVGMLIDQTKISIHDWIDQASNPLGSFDRGAGPSRDNGIKEGLPLPNPEGEYFGSSICLTGTLGTLTRGAAYQLAANVGFEIHKNFRKDTDYLLVGIQNSAFLAGNEKNSKQKKAEKLLSEGTSLRIIGECDFLNICKVG